MNAGDVGHPAGAPGRRDEVPSLPVSPTGPRCSLCGADLVARIHTWASGKVRGWEITCSVDPTHPQ